MRIPASITYIGDYAFKNCTSLVKAEYEENSRLTSIGKSAFYNCTSLETVKIPKSLSNIENTSIYYGCYSIKEFIVEEGNPLLKSIDGNLFSADGTVLVMHAHASSATHYEIPEGVTCIMSGAFRNSKNINSIVIPKSVTSIEIDAFAQTTSLTAVYYGGTTEDWGLISINSGNAYLTSATRYFYSETEPTTEGNFWHYVNGEPTPWFETIFVTPSEGLSFFSFGNGFCHVSSIGSCVDRNIVIPDKSTDGDKVVGIAAYAFAGCNNLESISIPDSVTSIRPYAFDGCNNLAYNKYDNAYYLGNASNPYLILLCAKDASITTCNINTETKIICSYAFSNCSKLKSIVIPDGVTNIGSHAFNNCISLESATIGNGVTQIEDFVFDGCKSLVYNQYDNAYYLGNSVNPYAILMKAKDTSIDSCNINASAKYIYYFAFSDCVNLTNIIIPSKVTNVDPYAFLGCKGLTTITISEGIKTIGPCAFENCSNLTDVYYTKTVEDWNKVSIVPDNTHLTNATIHYNYVPES